MLSDNEKERTDGSEEETMTADELTLSAGTEFPQHFQ